MKMLSARHFFSAREAHFSGTDFFPDTWLHFEPFARAFSRTNGYYFGAFTTPPEIRARGMGEGEESCAVCARHIVAPREKAIVVECCARRFHDLCIARHCAMRRDEVRYREPVVFSARRRPRSFPMIGRPDLPSREVGHLPFHLRLRTRPPIGLLPGVRRSVAQARDGRRGRREPLEAPEAWEAGMDRLRSKRREGRDGEGVRASL